MRRGVVRLTGRGRAVVGSAPPKLDNAFLLQFPEFRDFRGRSRQDDRNGSVLGSSVDEAVARPGAPEDQITAAVSFIEAKVRDELLHRLTASPPAFFEQAVVDLLLAMGYGSTVEDAGEALGKSGDGGVDGVIR